MGPWSCVTLASLAEIYEWPEAHELAGGRDAGGLTFIWMVRGRLTPCDTFCGRATPRAGGHDNARVWDHDDD